MTNIELWQSCVVDQARAQEIQNAASVILSNWIKYKTVGDKFGIPAYVIGCIHYREASFNFGTFLANGDPLFNSDGTPIKTIHVPQGLGPYKTWDDAAVVSLIHMGWNQLRPWDLANALDNLEKYNGLGYQKHGISSPYLWAATNHYTSGKYGADGAYDPNLVDKQLGCVPILMGLKIMGVELNEPKVA